MDPQDARLLAYAVEYSGLALPEHERPHVVYLSAGQIGQLMCGSAEPGCPIEGVYFGGSSVYVLAGLNSAHGRSIIVHEFTHWLQRIVGKRERPDTCTEAAASERQAYAVHNRYLRTIENVTDYTYAPVLVCGAQ